MPNETIKYTNRYVMIIDGIQYTVHNNEPDIIKNEVKNSGFKLEYIRDFINHPEDFHCMFYSKSQDKYMMMKGTEGTTINIKGFGPCLMNTTYEEYWKLEGNEFIQIEQFEAKDFVLCLVKNDMIIYGGLPE